MITFTTNITLGSHIYLFLLNVFFTYIFLFMRTCKLKQILGEYLYVKFACVGLYLWVIGTISPVVTTTEYMFLCVWVCSCTVCVHMLVTLSLSLLICLKQLNANHWLLRWTQPCWGFYLLLGKLHPGVSIYDIPEQKKSTAASCLMTENMCKWKHWCSWKYPGFCLREEFPFNWVTFFFIVNLSFVN